MVLGFRLCVCRKLVTIWWMANKRSFCFIITFHNFATLENRLTYQCPSSWPVVITMKKELADTWKKYRISAGRNEQQQVCNWWNPEKTGRSCEGADFSWLSSKVSRALKRERESESEREGAVATESIAMKWDEIGPQKVLQGLGLSSYGPSTNNVEWTWVP